jgi:hypothetical protein
MSILDDMDNLRDLLLEAERLHEKPFIKRGLVAGCPTCDAHKPGEMMPNHEASPYCESGKRAHCTCDVCF